MTPLTCERCGDLLTLSYSTATYSGVGQALQIAPDGAALVVPLGGMVACSWNCLAVLAAQRAGQTGDAAVRIVAERERQITAEGYSPEHDLDHPQGELAQAGAVYAMNRCVWPVTTNSDPDDGTLPTLWPWDPEWWKPKNLQRDLIRAGALIAAEADRDPDARRPKEEPF